MKPTFPGFPPEALQFLRDLKLNNHREWFQPRKQVYEEKVRGPMLELVAALGDEIAEFAPEMVTEPTKAVYRIYRDVRFSPDKSPYKTHIAAVFSPRGLEKHAGAGMYFHISVDEVLVGGGIYAPGPSELLAVRRHLAQQASKLSAILRERQFRSLFKEMTGEKLKRVPKGFPQDHPEGDLLVYKQYLAGTLLPPEIVTTPKLFRELLKHFRAITPFLRFLNEPLKPSRATPQAGLARAKMALRA
jgi:uncharacterized protein (TIGR02453 family)